MIRRLLWKVILGYICLRPFVSESAFQYFDLALSGIFLLTSLIYIFKNPLKTTPLDKIIFIFFLSMFISSLTSINVIATLYQLYKYLCLILLFYVVRLSSKEEQKQLIFILIISATFVSLYSLRSLLVVSEFVSEYIANHNINFPFAEEFLTRKRAFSPFISPNLLANYLIMIIMLNVGIIIQKIQQKERDNLFFMSVLCAILSLLTLFFTKSIGGWIALIVSVFIFLILDKMLNKKTAFIIFILIIALSFIFTTRIQENKYITQPAFSLTKRISYWKETIQVITQHPIRGISVGNFSLKESQVAHNSYLQIWAEMGLLGIISWLGIIFIFLKQRSREINSSQNKEYIIGILSSGIAFLFHNIIDFGFFVVQVSFLWWIILGLSKEATSS